MGNRGNIIIASGRDGAPEVVRLFLYTHWRGSDLPGIVANALARRVRWDDPPYLARILFCAMMGASDINGETGYGISWEYGDGGTDVFVNVDRKDVRMGEHGARTSFEDWIKLHT